MSTVFHFDPISNAAATTVVASTVIVQVGEDPEHPSLHENRGMLRTKLPGTIA